MSILDCQERDCWKRMASNATGDVSGVPPASVGMDLLDDCRFDKSTAFTFAEREALGLTGLLPDVVENEDMQLRRVLQQLGYKTTDLDRYIYLIRLLDRERDAVLPHLDVGSRPLPADRLRPDRRRGLPEVRPHLPAPARHVRLDQPQGTREGDPAQLAREGRSLHLRDQRRAHPGPRRSRRQRHGHPDRQAAALHGVRRRAAAGPAADGARFRHQQREPAQRPALSGSAPPARLRRRARQLRRRVRPCGAGGVSGAAASTSRIGRVSMPSVCSTAIATGSAATTTTSRERPAPRSPVFSARCA